MITELKEILQEGGTKVFTQYAVEIGDSLWCSLHEYLRATYPDSDNCCSTYRVEGIYEEEGGQKFAILASDNKYYRLNFSLTEVEGFAATGELVEVTKTFTPSATPQFAPEAVEAFMAQFAKKEEEEEEKEPEEEESEEEKKEYSLDEIPEYVEAMAKIEEYKVQVEQMTNEISQATTEVETLKQELNTLREFKMATDRKEKEAMIAKFYMLSDEDKADVVTNIDSYSLEDIEAKLSVICVRNKVSFKDDTEENHKETVFSLGEEQEDSTIPACVKAVKETAKNLNK